MGRAVIVEFCGPPGAGKSTLARALVRALRAEGRPIHPIAPPWRRLGGPLLRLKRGLHLAGLIARQPRRGGAAVIRAARVGRGGMGAARAALERFEWQRRLERGPLSAAILDEGALQSVWSLTLHAAQPPRRLAPCLRAPLTRAPRVLVVMRAPVAMNVGWIQARDARHGRLDQRPAEEIEAILRQHGPLFDRLVAESGAEIIEIQAEIPLEEQLAHLRAHLKIPPGPIGASLQP